MKNKTSVIVMFAAPWWRGVTTVNKVTDLPCQFYFDQDKALQGRAEHLTNYIQQPFPKYPYLNKPDSILIQLWCL